VISVDDSLKANKSWKDSVEMFLSQSTQQSLEISPSRRIKSSSDLSSTPKWNNMMPPSDYFMSQMNYSHPPHHHQPLLCTCQQLVSCFFKLKLFIKINLKLQLNFPTWSPPSSNASWDGCPQSFWPCSMFGVQRQDLGCPVIFSSGPPVATQVIPQNVHNSLIPDQVSNFAIKVSFTMSFLR
jgi:hypothetical protein